MNVVNLKIVALLGIWFLGSGCSTTEALREKYISADIRKAEELSKKENKLVRKISSNYFGHGSLPL